MNIVQTSNSKLPKLLFLFIVIASSFWIVGNTVNVYKYAFTGVVFEMLWLPILLITFAIPVISFICWYKKGYRISSPFLYLTAVTLLLNVLMITS